MNYDDIHNVQPFEGGRVEDRAEDIRNADYEQPSEVSARWTSKNENPTSGKIMGRQPLPMHAHAQNGYQSRHSFSHFDTARRFSAGNTAANSSSSSLSFSSENRRSPSFWLQDNRGQNRYSSEFSVRSLANRDTHHFETAHVVRQNSSTRDGEDWTGSQGDLSNSQTQIVLSTWDAVVPASPHRQNMMGQSSRSIIQENSRPETEINPFEETSPLRDSETTFIPVTQQVAHDESTAISSDARHTRESNVDWPNGRTEPSPANPQEVESRRLQINDNFRDEIVRHQGREQHVPLEQNKWNRLRIGLCLSVFLLIGCVLGIIAWFIFAPSQRIDDNPDPSIDLTSIQHWTQLLSMCQEFGKLDPSRLSDDALERFIDLHMNCDGLSLQPSCSPQELARFSIAITPGSVGFMDEEQRFALTVFFFSSAGLKWTVKTGWLEDGTNPCSDWYGIDCDELGNVIEISLEANDLSGSLPEHLFTMTSLEVLELTFNEITGTLSESIGDLTSLKVLHLVDTKLDGVIPTQLGLLTSLASFRINSMARTSPFGVVGTIPSELGLLETLRNLEIGSPHIEGSIPSEIINVTNLETLEVGGKFTGIIPSGIWEMPSLSHLEIHCRGDFLTTALSSERFFAESTLERIVLGRVDVLSPIPTTIGLLQNLSHFDMYDSFVEGTLPSEIGLVSSLQELLIVGSNLGGSIPSELGNLSSLRTLELANNKLTGQIPTEIGNCQSLEVLSFSRNILESTIPEELSALTNLNVFVLSGDSGPEMCSRPIRCQSVLGTFPSGMCAITSLHMIVLPCGSEAFGSCWDQGCGCSCSA